MTTSTTYQFYQTSVEELKKEYLFQFMKIVVSAQEKEQLEFPFKELEEIDKILVNLFKFLNFN